MLYEDEYVTFDEENYVLRIKDNVKKVESSIFSDFSLKYKELKRTCTVIIPDSVNYVTSNFLYTDFINGKKISIRNIKWPMKAQVLETETFKLCNKLEWINLPEGLKEIDHFAFCGCESLTDVVIPTTVTEVGKHIFCDCVKLEKIYVPRFLLSRYSEDYFKSSTSAKVIGYDSNKDLHKEYKLRFQKMKEILENSFHPPLKTQSNINRMQRIRSGGHRDIRERIREQMINIDVTVRLSNFSKSIPRIPKGMSQNSNSNPITSNPITEKKTAYKKTVSQSKEVKSFNGVIRKNLIAEKKKANGIGGE